MCSFFLFANGTKCIFYFFDYKGVSVFVFFKGVVKSLLSYLLLLNYFDRRPFGFLYFVFVSCCFFNLHTFYTSLCTRRDTVAPECSPKHSTALLETASLCCVAWCLIASLNRLCSRWQRGLAKQVVVFKSFKAQIVTVLPLSMTPMPF